MFLDQANFLFFPLQHERKGAEVHEKTKTLYPGKNKITLVTKQTKNKIKKAEDMKMNKLNIQKRR